MSRVHRNNFRTTLNGAITNVATAITLNDSFAAISSGETISLTIYGGGVYEIISIPYAGIGTAPAYTSISRGQEGTTAVAWGDGAKVECRVTRDSMDTKQDSLSGLAITNATVLAADRIPFQDASDSYNLKYDTAEAVSNIYSKLVFIESQTASSSAVLDFNDLGSLYAYYLFVIVDLAPATDNQRLIVRTSTDNGSTFASSAGNYAYAGSGSNTAASAQNIGSSADTEIELAISTGNSTGETLSGELKLFDPSAATYTKMIWETCSMGASTLPVMNNGCGVRLDSTAVDAIRFMFASGNIASGTIYLFGVKKT